MGNIIIWFGGSYLVAGAVVLWFGRVVALLPLYEEDVMAAPAWKRWAFTALTILISVVLWPIGALSWFNPMDRALAFSRRQWRTSPPGPQLSGREAYRGEWLKTESGRVHVVWADAPEKDGAEPPTRG